MSDAHEPVRFGEVDAATAKPAYRRALVSLDLTPQELLLGKVDEDGDILWSGCARWVFKHPGTLPVDGIVGDIFGPHRSDVDHPEDER